MIFHDEHGFLVDETSDGGDSAMRTGMLALFRIERAPLLHYYEHEGQCVRHPLDKPWNNPKNFTRDQLIPLTAGFYADGMITQARRVFWAHAQRGFFCQNFERDYPGSTKRPYPHTFTNDKGQNESRIFDFADPLMPDHIWHLIKCAKLYPLYWFAVIGIPFFVLSMFFHSLSAHREHNQIIAMAKVQGRWAELLFRVMTHNWREDLRQYWGPRNEIEYAEMIIEDLDSKWKNFESFSS